MEGQIEDEMEQIWFTNNLDLLRVGQIADVRIATAGRITSEMRISSEKSREPHHWELQ